MRKDRKMLGVVWLLSIFAGLILSGCFQKTVKVSPAEETAVVEDTISAKPLTDNKGGKGETATSAKMDSSPINEGAGPAESLETPVAGQGGTPAMSGEGLGAAGVLPGSRTDLGLLPIYFDFDKSLVRQDQIERLASNARYLKDNAKIKVRIEGNCDARGTNEYNLALGERRAMGAKKYLVNLGIADSRVSVLSYGEERPVNLGNDESAWAENRRGDFVVAQ